MVEVLVALAITAVVMTSVTVFLVSSRHTGRYNTLRDTALQLVTDGMEKARGVRGSALLSGRAQCVAPCAAPIGDAANRLLGADAVRWDAPATGTLTVPAPGAQADGSVVAAPGDPEVIQLDGLSFQRYYYLAACWQPAAGVSAAAITCTSSSDAAQLVRLVVSVTWRQSDCPAGICSAADAALFSSAAADPYIVG
jgi:type II secretory pathway pseudopilin PulG